MISRYTRSARWLVAVAVGVVACTHSTAGAAPAPVPTPTRTPNALTASDRDAGWQLLFDGKTMSGWRGFKMDSVPSSWRVEDGTLALDISGGEPSGHDLITTAKYDNFDLELEWKIAKGGNSGIFFHATEADGAIYWTAPEYQLLDDANFKPDGDKLDESAGSVYDLYPIPRHLAKPAGEWNSTRILVQGNHVQQWLNGVETADYVIGSADWNARVAGSKFAPHAGFAKSATGYIGLQDHGFDVAFRTIKIKVLP